MRVFISWSGIESKRAAKIVKAWLAETVFHGEDIQPFMSETDIPFGSDWWATLNTQLKDADCAIICLTHDNLSSAWLNFEGGAISIVKDKHTIPLLINIDRNKVSGGPFATFQSVTIQQDDIEKLVLDLKKLGQFKTPSVSHLPELMPSFYNKLHGPLSKLKLGVNRDYDRAPFIIYPEQITSVRRGKVFIGAPMASVEKDQYPKMREQALRIKKALVENTSATEVYCPCEKIMLPGQFDDAKRAIYEDFKVLKESEYYIFIYPEKSPSSILLEMGYAIALSKKTVIFTHKKSDLPFMLRKADESIGNLLIFTYRSIDNIVTKIKREGDSFLGFG
jgi:nucleoside 2-deoxyribosyltransferase